MADEKELINPSDIIFDDEDSMPVPETATYSEQQAAAPQDDMQNKILKPTYKFLKLFEDCMGQLPYNTILTNAKDEKIKLTSLFQFIEAKQNGMTVKDMNAIIAFIAPVEYKIVQPLMSIIDDNVKQRELWTIDA
jgi:hypothetical protein